MSKYFRPLSIQIEMDDYEELLELLNELGTNRNQFMRSLVKTTLNNYRAEKKEKEEKEKEEKE